MPAVLTYKVGVLRSHKAGPARWLSLRLEAAADGVHQVTLFFYEKDSPGLGFLNRKAETLVVNLPCQDFEPSYRILNEEKPVFVHFRVDPDEHKLLTFDLSTTEEPIGEGPVDHSS